MFACLLAVSSFSASEPPRRTDPIEIRLYILRFTLNTIRDTEDEIQQLKTIAKKSPQLAKQCEELIQRSAKAQRRALRSCAAQMYALLDDLGLQIWPYNVWKCLEEPPPAPKNNK
jgi:hypothetical protein